MRPVRDFVSLCHTELQQSLMSSWEEVGHVCWDVRLGKGKKKYFCLKHFCRKYFCLKYFQWKYFHKKYFCHHYIWEKYFCQQYFRQKNPKKNISPKGGCPQGLGWNRAIARSQPSVKYCTTSYLKSTRGLMSSQNSPNFFPMLCGMQKRRAEPMFLIIMSF